ncbi:MAG: hypothetical protein AAF226_13085, partial [Verrucomicrobiota bacterium]
LIAERFFKNKPSVINRNQRRWTAKGVLPEDITAAYRDVLDGTPIDIQGAYLYKQPPEELRPHLEEVHEKFERSIRLGVPPILSLRSYVARQSPGDSAPRWQALSHHFVVVTAVPKRLSKTAGGFEASIIDPNGARLTSIFLHPEPNRMPFLAARSSRDEDRWVSGYPFLTVSAPEVYSLTGKPPAWHERVVVVANYLTGRF